MEHFLKINYYKILKLMNCTNIIIHSIMEHFLKINFYKILKLMNCTNRLGQDLDENKILRIF